MKKLSALILSLALLISGLVLAAPASAMPCNGPGCGPQSNTGYPEGKKPGTIFTKTGPAVVTVDCLYNLKTSHTVTTTYTYKKDRRGVWQKVILSQKSTFLFRPPTKKECPK